ncbi:sodium/potassium-transporting ATPase subunit alpha [Rhodotorula toruloides]|uniref:Sodium/potassium-transporting ATPase subunit alpha n=1 Tax=Rhodotorula toruloides TaxID=5286 RepID=A0A511KJK6_RHOTO|nr:sodium/potassium-transporting ATPase subunit alpha [Rhodotorula toruloides]
MFDKKSDHNLESTTSRFSTVQTALPVLNSPHCAAGTQLRRMSTIDSVRALPRVQQQKVRMIGDFRTLSIHVTESRGAPKLVDKARRKAAKDIDDIATLDWHMLSADEVCQRLGAAPKSGLDKEMAPRPNDSSLPQIFWYFFGGFGTLLFVSSIRCFVAWKPLGEPNPSTANLALAVVLLIVVLLQAIFNAWQDFTTSRTMASIAGVLPTSILLSDSELAMGDIVILKLGAKVPADIRLIEVSSDLKFGRSILTGESVAVGASIDSTNENFMETKNIALQGTLCTEGSAVGVVVGRGNDTIFGRIAKAAGGKRPGRSTLEVEIARFVLIIAGLALSVVAVIVIFWAAFLRRKHPEFINVPTLVVGCVSVAVAFIPEGLPFCVTMSLPVIARQMKRKGVLCKSLTTVESLGSVSLICSDKTGTLTQNKMSVANVVVGDTAYNATEALKVSLNPADLVHSALNQLISIAAVCNDATFVGTEDEAVPTQDKKVAGDATDTGLLRFAASIASVGKLRSTITEVGKLAFSSCNKFALKLVSRRIDSLAVLTGLTDELNSRDQLLLTKGAPDILMRCCTLVLQPDGTTAPFTEDAQEALSAVQKHFASLGQRVLLFAKRSVSNKTTSDMIGTDEEKMIALIENLTVVGLVALANPPKYDSRETVERCRAAGIRFFTVTGDFALTAATIARQVGIITCPPHLVKGANDLAHHDNSAASSASASRDKLDKSTAPTALVLSGSDLLKLSETQWAQFDEIVFARTSPQQKLQIVKRFQDDGCTVGCTGNGTNDSPALKQADVGVAIAGGSDVAMEAADLVLLDDYSAIVTGIESGRLCFENLKKISTSCPFGSFSELTPVLLNVFLGLPQALSSIQMILICAITDVLPGIGLCYEKPEADLLLRPPRRPKQDHLADSRLIIHAYAFLGLLESLTSMVAAFYFGFQRQGIPFSALWLKYGNYPVDANVIAEATNRAQSLYFFNLVICQWFNLLSTRTRRRSIFQQDPLFHPRTRNLRLFPAMLPALVLGIFFSYPKFFQDIFLTRAIPAPYFFLPAAHGLCILGMEEARKLAVRRWPNGLVAKTAW